MTDKEEKFSPKNIEESIEHMTALLAKEGIAKDKGGVGEIKYKFRGIDDIRNTIAPLQKECNLIILPSIKSRDEIVSTTKNGGFALRVIISVEFVLINTVDKSSINIIQYADAIDYSDKATSKAMSQAYKTFAINVFNIPTEGEQKTDEEAKELTGTRVGVFESDELRRQWKENCSMAFEQAENALKLKEVESFYHDKLVVMSASKDPAEIADAQELRGLFASKLSSFKTEQKGKL